MKGRDSKTTRGEIARFRRSQGWSQKELAHELANGLPRVYGRSYIANVEAGLMPVSKFIEARFKILRARVRGEQVQSRDWLIRGRAPKRLVIGKVRRCPICRWHFPPHTPNQKYCGPECSRKARKGFDNARDLM